MGEDDEQHQVTLSPFRIQEHEVTNAEYRRFDSHRTIQTRRPISPS